MEKGITTLKHISRLKYSQVLRNCWPSIAVQKSDAIIRLIHTPLRMCCGTGM